jgi:hypothetical protein
MRILVVGGFKQHVAAGLRTSGHVVYESSWLGGAEFAVSLGHYDVVVISREPEEEEFIPPGLARPGTRAFSIPNNWSADAISHRLQTAGTRELAPVG